MPQDHVTGVGDMFCNGDFQTFKATMDRPLDKNIDYTPTETPHTLLMVLHFQLRGRLLKVAFLHRANKADQSIIVSVTK